MNNYSFVKDRICKFCHQTFKNIPAFKFGGHVARCKDNPISKKFDVCIVKSSIKRYNNLLGKLKFFKVVCYTCKKEFKVKEREKQFPIKEKYFCSVSCGHKYSAKQNIGTKIGKCKKCGKKIIVDIKADLNDLFCTDCKVFYCKKCNKIIGLNNKSGLCKKCYYIEYGKTIPKFRKYQLDCKFRFNLNEYPDRFDFDLLTKCKAYHPVRNQSGLSRDHIVSVKYGFDNNIPAEIIRHPANCQLIKQTKNSEKHTNCGMTVKQLKEKILNWNKNKS